jgi:ABC-type nitrate/sulfonate/bicarbonate transport system substrate-binding protein
MNWVKWPGLIMLSTAVIVLLVEAGRTDHRDDHVRIAVVPIRRDSIPPYIIKKKEIYRPQGIQKWEEKRFRNSDEALKAVINGEVDIAIVSATVAIGLHLQGNPVRIIAISAPVAPYSLIGRPEIKDVSNLRDRVVAAGAGEETFLLTVSLERFGVKPGEYKVQSVGPTRDKFDLLFMRPPAAHGAMLAWPDHLQALEKGLKNLIDIPDLLKEYAYGVVVVGPEWPKKFSKAVVGVLRTLVSANDWILKTENSKEVISLVRAYFREELGREITDTEAGQLYELIVKKGFVSKDLRPERARFNLNVQFFGLEKAKAVKTEVLIDPSFFKEATR